MVRAVLYFKMSQIHCLEIANRIHINYYGEREREREKWENSKLQTEGTDRLNDR